MSEGHSPTISSPPLSHLPNAKRKRVEKDDTDDVVANKAAKRKRARQAKKAKYSNDEDLDQQSGLNLAIGRFDNRLLADHIAQRTKRFSPKLSLVELEDLHIPGETRTTDLAEACGRLQGVLKTLRKRILRYQWMDCSTRFTKSAIFPNLSQV